MEVDADNSEELDISEIRSKNRCQHCGQTKDAIINCSEPLQGATIVEEDLLNMKELKAGSSDLPYLRITNFRVYDEARHLFPFDELGQNDITLYFSGIVKPFSSENSETSDGYPCEEMGPLISWWYEGYNLNEETVLGFSSELAHYYLMEPSSEYVPCMARLNEKIFVLKTVIDILKTSECEYEELDYECFLNILRTKDINEDKVLRNGVFICKQIMSYDSDADIEDKLLSVYLCIRTLIRNVDFNNDVSLDLVETDDDYDSDFEEEIVGRQRKRRDSELQNRVNKKRSRFTMATVTPLVESICGKFLRSRNISNYIKDSSASNISSPFCDSSLTSDNEDPGVQVSEFEDEIVDLADTGAHTSNDFKECENKKNLQITLPVLLQFEKINLRRLSKQTVKFYLNKLKVGQPNRKRSIQSSDSEIEFIPKKRRSPKPIYSSDSDESQHVSEKKETPVSPIVVQWLDEPIEEIKGYKYFKAVLVKNFKVFVGDFVSTLNSNSIARVKYLFENTDGEKLFHAQWYKRSLDTILSEFGHPNELFESNTCDDILLNELYEVVNCDYISTTDWALTDNLILINRINMENDPTNNFFFQKRYCDKTARFEDVKPELPSSPIVFCSNCVREEILIQKEIPFADGESTFDSEMKMYALTMVRWRDEEYRVGSCIFLNPGTIIKSHSISKKHFEVEEDSDYDEDLYPEKYRKRIRMKSVQNEDVVSDPFDIGYICNIWSEQQYITSSVQVKLKLKKFYRPHNTCLSKNSVRKLDLNLLYWSDEDCLVNLSQVQGKCFVTFEKNLKCPIDEWTNKGPYRFYFDQSYNAKCKLFETPPPFAIKLGNVEKINEKDHIGLDIPPEYPPISRPLRALTVFSGCGGFTEGLHQAKVTECAWAIENDPAAAHAFQLNYPKATMFVKDCNVFLKTVIEDQENKKLPKRGDVEILYGGPPCRGFSVMNRFSRGQLSQFNNSLMVTFLSYCDYYRPRFFIMENVRNFVAYRKSVVLKLTLNCLVKMGYQVTFGVLQGGRFGIPQSRRRMIILAAAPGEILPIHPEPSHTFPHFGKFEIANIDDIQYAINSKWMKSAPYRMITVYDAISDLPPIIEDNSQEERPYSKRPQTHFQRQLRVHDDIENTVLKDHVTKSLLPIESKRLSLIPKKPGSDWRDLPNIVIKLNDGTYTKKLKYTHHDEKHGKSSTGALRGVCSCIANFKCRPEFRQTNTLIPWCLVHTSNRHAHWRGVYGRLQLNDYFQTLVTNPKPLAFQGFVVHPLEDRVISIRECARSQGFPDDMKFGGYIYDKYRQVGNAVPPPLAKAIGLEIRKSVHQIESRGPPNTFEL